MAWLRYIGGKLKSDFRYSIGIVYNTYPWPKLDDDAKAELGRLGDEILAVRAGYKGENLATLYDPDLMPGRLRQTHLNLDKFVDSKYQPKGFSSERERIEALLAHYEALVTELSIPLLASEPIKKKSPRKRSNNFSVEE
jgi:hypothetical protein